MSKDPWFRFFPSDWLAGTAALSAAERGVYITLLASMYDEGGAVERSDERLARRCGLPKFGFVRALEALIDLGKITEENGCLTNSRAKTELTERDSRIGHCKEGARVTNGKKQAKSNVILRSSERSSERSIAATRASVLQPQPYKEDSVTTILPEFKHLPVQEKPADAKSRNKRIEYPPDFEPFWTGYPTDSNMAKAEALKPWKLLSEDDRQAAIKSLPAFRAYCTSHPDYRPIHACRYLSARRFEGHLAAAEKRQSIAGIFVPRDSKPWEAWSKYWFDTKGQSPPTNGKGGWYFPTEWPPKLEHSQ
jgi:uncharacterized protein YdaU (DUF1376 family)